jgi:YidC/Oxa1 family membrane protein insertase
MVLSANIFQPLITVFEAVLKFFHNSIGVPWGWSIILLTIVIRLLLVPLAVKQFHSMQKLQRLAPEMKKVQARYKDDKQRQQQEIMKLYQEHGVNPFGSCLPLAAQIPVMISLYFMLRQDLRKNICPQVQLTHHVVHGHWVPCGPHGGASFLFINDLTNSAKGASLIALAVLYVVTQLGASMLMSVKSDDPQQERMRKMMMFMPVLFVFIFLSFPTGVIVYYITFNLFMIPQQLYIRRRLGPPTALGADRAGPGPAGGGGPPPSDAGPNGSGGLGGLLRGLAGGQPKAEEEPEPVGAGARTRTRTSAPPPPPRKKKKRSGRRR